MRAAAWSLILILGACSPAPPEATVVPERPEVSDRRELVLQPRRGWTPEAQGLKVTILLIGEKSRIKAGEKMRYRVELRNVGGETVVFKEAAPSFIKEGSLCGGLFYFEAGGWKGKRRGLGCREAFAGAVSSGLNLALRPGEYLLTRRGGDSDRFRDLETSFVFVRGTYRLRVGYAPLGAVSNTVVLEVY